MIYTAWEVVKALVSAGITIGLNAHGGYTVAVLEWVNSADIPKKHRFDYIREEIWLKRNGMDVKVASHTQLDFRCLALAFPCFHLQRVAMSAAEIHRTRTQAIQCSDTMAVVSWSAGPVHVECDDSEIQLQQGQAMMLASSVRSRSVMPESEFVCLSLDTDRLWRLLPRPPVPGVVALEPCSLNLLLSQYLGGLLQKETHAQQFGPEEQAMITDHVYELTAACLSRGTREWCERFSDTMHLAHYRQALRIIHQRLSDPELTVVDIAQTLGVSLRYLQGLFQDRGETCRGVIRRSRLELASERLQSSDWRHASIIQIALSVGFSDHSHFTKCFKRYFGNAPRALRIADNNGSTSR